MQAIENTIEQQEEVYEELQYINENKPAKMNTGIDIFKNAWRNKMMTKHYIYHSSDLADKQITKKIYNQTHNPYIT